jgi:nitrogen fixation NifU-like protein
MLNGASVELPAELTPLRGVAPFAGRHGCARMPWQALRDALG